MIKVEKRKFNPTNVKDLSELKYFVKNGKWKTSCPFELEYPYLSVVDMSLRMFANLYIDSIIKTKRDVNKKSFW